VTRRSVSLRSRSGPDESFVNAGGKFAQMDPRV
jgi:hypothetical protein